MLTYIQINAAKPRAKAWNLSDSQGLYLVIQPNGSKLWRFNYRFLDKQKKLHLGGWPTISLADARARRDEAKKKLAEGIDPALEKKRARIAAKYAAANTFQAVAEEWLVKCKRDGLAPVTVDKIRWLLAKAYPLIGTIPIAQITPHEALAVLRKVEANLTQAVEIHPGAPPQFAHRDQDMWAGPKGSLEYLVNVMWPIDRFTAENGGTRLWPGSHADQDAADLPEDQAVVPDIAPGDALLFLGSTLHGSGGNRSTAPRRGIVVSYALGWLKPFELQWLVYPPAVARSFSPELAALVGYSQHRPNLGNVEGQCPSVLLGDDVPEHLGAIDALRPDQDAMAASFLAGKQR